LPQNRGIKGDSAAFWGREGPIFGEKIPGELGERSSSAKQTFPEG